jgi:hypothetical protein
MRMKVHLKIENFGLKVLILLVNKKGSIDLQRLDHRGIIKILMQKTICLHIVEMDQEVQVQKTLLFVMTSTRLVVRHQDLEFLWTKICQKV